MSHVTCHLSHVTFHMSHVTCHMSHVTCHMSHVTCHMSHVTCHMSEVTCHMSHVTCHMSHVTCHMSHVTCHMSHVTCHMSRFIYLFFFFRKIGEAYRWRVCYQRGLPRLVLHGVSDSGRSNFLLFLRTSMLPSVLRVIMTLPLHTMQMFKDLQWLILAIIKFLAGIFFCIFIWKIHFYVCVLSWLGNTNYSIVKEHPKNYITCSINKYCLLLPTLMIAILRRKNLYPTKFSFDVLVISWKECRKIH